MLLAYLNGELGLFPHIEYRLKLTEDKMLRGTFLTDELRGRVERRKVRVWKFINLLKPIGYVMHQQLYHSTIVRSAQTVFTFCIYLRINSDLCHLRNKLIGFYNPDEKCLQRGTDWVFK